MTMEVRANPVIRSASQFRHKQADRARRGNPALSGGRVLTKRMPYQVAFARAREDADIAAQHGPVRILWKDGKPVPPEVEP